MNDRPCPEPSPDEPSERMRRPSAEAHDNASPQIKKAYEHVYDLCHGDERWRMTIPVDEDRDSDCIIVDGLNAGVIAEARVEALEAWKARAKVVLRVAKSLTIARPVMRSVADWDCELVKLLEE